MFAVTLNLARRLSAYKNGHNLNVESSTAADVQHVAPHNGGVVPTRAIHPAKSDIVTLQADASGTADVELTPNSNPPNVEFRVAASAMASSFGL